MRVVIFGATGMLGQGVLRECLLDATVTRVVAIGRHRTGSVDPRLDEIVVPDLFEAAATLGEVRGFDACFFCLGVSAFGMSETSYTRVTHDLTLAIAAPLSRDNPGMTFAYVSGAGTNVDGRAMWSRVKGRTEAALAKLPLKAVYLFRPGFVQPMDGIASKTRLYRLVYVLSAPVASTVVRLLPDAVTTTQKLGRAMIAVARRGYATAVLSNADINRAAHSPS